MTYAKIVAILDARDGKAEELEALLRGLVKPVRAEPGNLRWDIWTDPARPGRFVLDELYVDRAAVAAHRETPHFLDYVSRIGDLAERTAIVVDPLEVAQELDGRSHRRDDRVRVGDEAEALRDAVIGRLAAEFG